MRLKKGMTVKVITGNHKGVEGKILKIFLDKNRVIIEGVNFIKKAVRPTQDNPSGGFVEKEAAINVSNVMMTVGGQSSKIGYKILDDGSKIRISKKTGEELGS